MSHWIMFSWEEEEFPLSVLRLWNLQKNKLEKTMLNVYNIINERMSVDEMLANVKAVMVLLQEEDAIDKFELILNNAVRM